MEVKLDKTYPVAATLEQAWAVLANVQATAACMPGAQITEQLDATHYKGTVKSKIGPAVMTFNGDIEVQGLDETKRELRMLGKGADRGGSSASMQLTAHLAPAEDGDPGACVLVGTATVMVSGKLAQFGNRLLVPVSDAMLAQFADNFRAAAAAVPVAEALVGQDAGQALGQGADASTAPTQAASSAGGSSTATPLPVAPRPTELNALALMWVVFKGWLAGLFSKKKA